MIYSLNGEVIFKDHICGVIDCGGVGYKFLASSKTLACLAEKGNKDFVYTYMHFKQDGVDLFGFSDEKELQMFKDLISVSNVGPKLAIAILSTFTAEQIISHIANGEAKEITRAPGVGLKSAQRIVLELKDKVGSAIFDTSSDSSSATSVAVDGSAVKDAISALVQFGYPLSEATATVRKCDTTKPTSDIIKQALRLLSTNI